MNIFTSKFSTIVKTILICNCLFLFSACSSVENRLTDFSSEKWIANGTLDDQDCVSYRSTVYKGIIEQQSELIGISEIDVVTLFGKPDQVHISKRMRKSVFYCINGCNECSTTADVQKFLVVDFETLRRVKTIRISFATE